MSAPPVTRPAPGTSVPRWTVAPRPGRAVREVPLPGPEPDPVSLLTAHAVVLAALSGEHEVVTGVVLPEGLRTCRIETRGSWRDVYAAARRALAQPEVGEEPTEAVLGAGPPGDEALRVWTAGGLLRVAHRTDVLDAGAATRIAGYHATALARLVTDPAARPGCLLSAGELRWQRTAFHGPTRRLPPRSVPDLVADRARETPKAIAVTCGDTDWTYGELLDRADRVAAALRDRGLRPEDRVAVMGERDLDWAAAVLGVLRAGGAYLPVEPRLPRSRIERMLDRAGCRLALVTAGPELPAGVEPVSTAGVEPVAQRPVGLERLAYVYFTSGSTGEPKGAMCEHAGMLNHMLAKVEDLGIRAGTVVAQTAPQGFDISLWQLVAPWLVGGRTLVVTRPEVLDVRRFVQRLRTGRVEVAQLVPSYLEAVLTHLEADPRPLPDLRCVSATGEALTAELARRWFTTGPGVRLINAYGLTETSDDTNHHVMDSAPEGSRVPLGRAVPNVGITIVDEDLAPVPLGAPGEIVFSGVCVGRGYIGDPERTREAFLSGRRYRAGDHGRWRPDGTLEYLGRRDGQLKIAGQRIEIGEIENALLQVPGVRAAAVVAPGGTRLAAFVSGPAEPAELAAHLAERLPRYMVPATFHRCEPLPLTSNGKIDRRALTAAAEARTDSVDPPRTHAERAVAAAWAAHLGIAVDTIARTADFAALGGSSLVAVKVVLDLGRALTLTEVLDRPVLADLAALYATRHVEEEP